MASFEETRSTLLILYVIFTLAKTASIINNTIICNEEYDSYCYWNTDLSCTNDIGNCKITCNAAYSCWGSTINCAQGNECNITCIGDRTACQYAKINCADDNICNIKCAGCASSTINCPDSNDCVLELSYAPGSVIQCPDNGYCNIKCYSCHSKSNIICPNNGDCNIICNRLSSSEAGGCSDSMITCPNTGDCQIFCGYQSCNSATIICPTNGECSVQCISWTACHDLYIDGSKASKLIIMGCITRNSCLNIIVKCPPNVKGNKRCFIQGNDEGFYGDYNDITGGTHGLVFYAINSWKDVDFNAYFGSLFGKDGIMFCTTNYSKQCTISNNGWFCDNQSSICNDPPTIPTSSPTTFPSTEPTMTTMYPTVHPTIPPTEPTLYPSILPTIPTTELIIHPTTHPTMIPVESTAIPTTQPSALVLSTNNNKILIEEDKSWEIIVIVLCVVVFILIIMVIGLFLYMRTRQNDKSHNNENIQFTPINNAETEKEESITNPVKIHKTEIQNANNDKNPSEYIDR